MGEQSIIVRHNVEMGHRLSMQPDSKCYHLHGHSWWVELSLTGEVDSKGMVLGLNFGYVKKLWRDYLDETYDHHLCLNEKDPLIELVSEHSDKYLLESVMDQWGIVTIPEDPTVENMAAIWGGSAWLLFNAKVDIKVAEAATNAATWRSYAS